MKHRTTRYNLEVEVLEQAYRYPATPSEVEEAQKLRKVELEAGDQIVSGRSIDECREKVRHLAEVKLGRILRGLSVGPGPNGKPATVRVVVYPPEVQKKGSEMKASRLRRGR